MSEDATHTTLPVSAEDTANMTRAYGFMIMGLILTIVPLWFVSGFGALLLLVGIIYTYTIKRGLGDKPVSLNHRRWLIRTFWLTSLVMLVCIILAWGYTSTYADNTPIENMMLGLEDGSMTPELAIELTREYQLVNKTVIKIGDAIVAVPTVLYMLARMVRGYRLLDKHQAVANVKTWLV